MDNTFKACAEQHGGVMSRFEQEFPDAVRPSTTASLIAAGVSRRQVNGSRWRTVARGLQVPESVRITTTQRIVEAATAMGPRGVLAGWAAAFVHGIDQLDGRNDFTYERVPVPILMPRHIHRLSTQALDYRQDELDPSDVDMQHGVRVTTPTRTVLDLMSWSPDLVEAVVGLDAALAGGIVTSAQLESSLPVYSGHPGSARAATALSLGVPGVLSSWETRLRMFCQLVLNWPPLLVNQAVFDSAGTFLGRPDLLDEEAGLALEYDGAQWTGAVVSGGHRNREQHRRDNVREELFERTGLIVIRADKADMTRHRSQLRLRLQRARRDGLQRDRSRDRWTTHPPCARSVAHDALGALPTHLTYGSAGGVQAP